MSELVLLAGDVYVDPTTGRFVAGATRGRLTAVERVLLVVLVAHRGEPVSRGKLFAATHGGRSSDPNGLRAIDQAVSRLRRRLFGGRGSIVAVRGMGYRLAVPPLDAAAPAGSQKPSAFDTRSAALIGRDTEIAVIEAQLAAHRRPPQRVELVGAGGIGKSSIAREVARRARERGEHALWVGLAGADDEVQVLARIASAFGVIAGSARPAAQLHEALEARVAALGNGSRVLMVLDDADNASAVLGSLIASSPSLAASRVLVTARRKTGLPLAQGLAIGPLTATEALTLLIARGWSTRLQPPDADELALLGEVAEALGGWPLALELAAARIRDAKDVHQQMRTLAASGARELAGIEAVLESTWATLDAAERTTSSIIALAGGDAPIALLGPHAPPVDELYRTGWLGHRAPRVELHAIVRDFVLARSDDRHRRELASLFQPLGERIRGTPLTSDPRVSGELAGVAPQLAVASELPGLDAATRAFLLLILARHHLVSGPRERAIAIAERLLALVPLVGPIDRRELREMRAWLLMATGEGDGGVADARAFLDEAPTDEARVEGLMLVARTHRHAPEVAESALREALLLPLSPIEHARAESVLASFYTREERYDEALAPMMRALETLEEKQVDTRWSQANYLAVILTECGMALRAKAIFERAESAYTRMSRGPLRPGFIATRALLALDAGDGATAGKHLGKLIDTADRTGRPNLAAIAAVWAIAAAILEGRHDVARERSREAVSGGPDRVGRLWALSTADLAFFHALEALLDPARASDQLDIARRLLGDRYPATSWLVATIEGSAAGRSRVPTGVRVRLARRLVASVG